MIICSRAPFAFAPLFLALALSSVALAAHAQVSPPPPDAGTLRQQLQQQPGAAPAEPAELRLQAPVTQAVAPGGPRGRVQSFVFEGHTVFSEEQLQALLADTRDESLDLAGMRALADRVTRLYQAAGYGYARALLPAQTLSQGVLRIQVLEGRYGRVQANSSTSAVADAVRPWLAPLQPGALIETPALERRIRLLGQLPGLVVDPVLDPGANVGEGDLSVNVEAGPRFGGRISADNNGNRYTGATRLGASLWANGLLMLGDRATADALVSTESMWLGALGYERPLGVSGMRGEVHVSRSAYELAKDFAALDARGVSDTVSAGVSYPLLRDERGGLTLSLSVQHSRLRDDVDSIDRHTTARSDTLPASLRFDARDTLLPSAGLSYGEATWTAGRVKLDATLLAADQGTARSNGHFNKFNLNLTRLQALPAGMSLYAHLSGQWADRNLHSSERFGLGGAAGVRAYPLGEGYGDKGWLVQTELRLPALPIPGGATPGTPGTAASTAIIPYAFFDIGRVTINASPWAGGENARKVSGAGVGARAALTARWNADASLAWRTHGGRPQSDTRDAQPLLRANLAYVF